VGRRLAAGLHPGDGARIALAADQEDSPLQSKRSSRFFWFLKLASSMSLLFVIAVIAFLLLYGFCV